MKKERIRYNGTFYTLLPGGEEIIKSAKKYFWFHVVLFTILFALMCAAILISSPSFVRAIVPLLIYSFLYTMVVIRSYEQYQEEKSGAIKSRGIKTAPPKSSEPSAETALTANQDKISTRIVEDTQPMPRGEDKQKKKP